MTENDISADLYCRDVAKKGPGGRATHEPERRFLLNSDVEPSSPNCLSGAPHFAHRYKPGF